MTEFCWFLKFIFLLVMMSSLQNIVARPVSDNSPSELIAGNEFLQMFLEHQQLHGNDEQSLGGNGGSISVADEIGKPASNNRSHNARSLDYKARRNGNENEQHKDDNNKQQQEEQQQVVKLVTSGSKIVFLEEYDDDDAIVDAVAREIDLQREHKLIKHNNHNNRAIINKQQTSNAGEQYKVVAVSVSSSTKRGSEKPQQHRQQRQQYKQQMTTSKSTTSRAPKFKKTTLKTTTSASISTTTATPTTTVAPYKRRPIAALPYDNADFINLSHKSELSIEETEPLTMTPRQQRQQQHKQQQQQQQHIFNRKSHLTSLDTVSDSENSASTNVQNVLAAPLSHQNNKTNNSLRNGNGSTTMPDDMEDKLLPFQTVIYHDTRSGEGHGPQSRSISYSSLSQNVDDIHSWQRSTGILAEAQRNVNESLKPTLNTKSNTKSESESAAFYSVPAKMYSEPAKFYSEPAKVYSEPAKVYGEPAKFYSEPAKVYSQPAKVYGEPAKTYWPQSDTESTSTTTTTDKGAYVPPSRRPAIVSRIAFGEAQTSSTTSTTTTTTVRPPIVYRNHHSHYTQTRLQQQQQQQQQKSGHVSTQPRRVLFNLDRLPYDLLNAPVPTSTKQQHQAEPQNLADLAHGPISCFESELPLTASVSTSSASSATAIAQTAVSSLTVTHQPQQQQLLLIQQQQQQQHSSLSDQHSNQNAKRLPNRDLVKCVAKYIHPNGVGLPDVPAPAAVATHLTTERNHSEDIYSPTPEQNYEIEESVSVMTDGRAHGVVLGGMAGQKAATSTARPAYQRGAIRGNTSSLTTSLYHQQHGANANANKNHNHSNDGDDDDEGNYNYDDDEDAGNTEEKAADDDSKVAYVVEGQNYRKYRVEEKTDDGFIVGEYGVVDHNDGNLRGVRYTADSTINPSLIQKALLTFLKLK